MSKNCFHSFRRLLGRPAAPARAARQARRSFRPRLELLEDRCTPSVNVTEFGVTAGSAPRTIVQAADGNLWFTEFNNNALGRITPGGGVTEFSLAALGSGVGPSGLAAASNGLLYFTEFNTGQIGSINPKAGTVAQILASETQSPVVPSGAGAKVSGITQGPDGNLWFTETAVDRVAKATPDLVTIMEFTGITSGSGPLNITTGPDGALWFTELIGGRIGRITTGGTVTNQFAVPTPNSGPDGITVGPDGALWFTAAATDQIGRVTTAGAFSAFALPNGSVPQGIKAGPGGQLYFVESGRDIVARISTSGTVAEISSGVTPGATPYDLAFGPDGNAWFTERDGNAIGRLVPPPIAPVAPAVTPIEAVASGGVVTVFGAGHAVLFQFTPYAGYQGPISVAVGDVNHDGVADIVTGAGPGAGPHVKVFSGKDLTLLASFYAYAPSFTGGVNVAVGDVNGDGSADIITGAGPGGGPHVKVIDGTKLGLVQANGEISDAALLASFFAFAPSFTGGVNVAVGDVNHDGVADVVVGAGPGGGPQVKVIDGTKLGLVQANGEISDAALLASFFAYAPSFTGGVNVAVGDVNHDGLADVVTGAGPGGAPHVEVVDAAKLGMVQANGEISSAALLASFFAYSPAFMGGVHMGSADANGDGFADVVAGAGPGGGPAVEVVDGTKLGLVQANGQIAAASLLQSFFAGNPSFTGGVFVTAGVQPAATPTAPAAQNDPTRGVRDLYLFKSPQTATNTVLALTANSFAGAVGGPPAAFDPARTFAFNIDTSNPLMGVPIIRYLFNFSAPDANGVQTYEMTVIDNTGDVIGARGSTGQNVPIVGGTGMLRAAVQDDPFYFDQAGFNNAVAAGDLTKFPRPPGQAVNFYGPNANAMAIVIEQPTARFGAPGNVIGVWADSEINNGIQVDRVARPMITTMLIPPVPRNNLSRGDRRTAFTQGEPVNDRAAFKADMTSVLTNPGFYFKETAATADTVSNLLLPDLLVYQLGTTGNYGDTVTAPITSATYFGNGRKFTDPVVHITFAVLTGGTITTDNVDDDNGFRITDGTVIMSGAGKGQTRAIAFPYIGAANLPLTGPGTAPNPQQDLPVFPH
jgi:streptogramin lyase